MGLLEDSFADLPRTLSIEQLAEVLGVKRATAYQWLNKGVVPAYKLGGTWIIYRDEVFDHLRQSRNQPAGGQDAPGDDA